MEVSRGQAVQIFTGAPIPPGIVAMSMQEDCESDGETVVFHERSQIGDHIRRAGSDFTKGATILRKGDFLGPASIGAAMSAGIRDLSVHQIPDIFILSTGSELLDISHELMPWKIYDSNRNALSSAVGLITEEWTSTTASDKPEVLTNRMRDVMLADIVITSGGVSVGEYDLLKEEFARWNVVQQFWGVAIKPGKPVYFGTQGRKMVFGLPGNPVSTLVTYALFVRPAILRRMGHPDPWPKPVRAVFRGSARKRAGRMEFLRGKLDQDGATNVVSEVGEQGSHQMAVMAAADCLIQFPLDAERLDDGDIVDVIRLRWGIEA